MAMISYEKIKNGALKFGKKVKEIWQRFWNSLFISVKKIMDQFMTRFKEKIDGISLAIKRVSGSFKRVNSVYTKSGNGYKRTDIMTNVNTNDVPEELQYLNEGEIRDITNDFEDVLVLEY